MKDNILIIGAGGTVSLEIAQLLASKNFNVHIGVKNLTRASMMHIKGIQLRHFDYTDPLTYDTVFENIQKLILVSPPLHLELHGLVEAVIDQAANMGVEQIVNISALNIANDEHPMRAIEERIGYSGIPFSILRPNFYMQRISTFFRRSITLNSEIVATFSNDRVSMIDLRDVAEITEKLIAKPFQENKTFMLTGADALSWTETCEKLSAILNRQISFVKLNENDYFDYLMNCGYNRELSQQFMHLCQSLDKGWQSVITGDVEFILGRKATPFEKFALDHKNEWKLQSVEDKIFK